MWANSNSNSHADWKSVSNGHSYCDSPGHCYTYSASHGYTDRFSGNADSNANMLSGRDVVRDFERIWCRGG